MIQLSQIVSARPDLLATEIDGELVMMDMDSGRYVNLDRIGTIIWRELAAPRTVADLCKYLGEHFEASSDEIERDVLSFLDEMEIANLLRMHG